MPRNTSTFAGNWPVIVSSFFFRRWRQCSRFFLRFIIRYAAPNSHEVAGACCIAHESFEFREGHSPNTGQKCPLVGMRIEVGIQENTIGVSARHVLQRRGDEVAEAALGPCPGSERIGRRSRGQADGDAPSCASEWLHQACGRDLQATVLQRKFRRDHHARSVSVRELRALATRRKCEETPVRLPARRFDSKRKLPKLGLGVLGDPPVSSEWVL